MGKKVLSFLFAVFLLMMFALVATATESDAEENTSEHEQIETTTQEPQEEPETEEDAHIGKEDLHFLGDVDGEEGVSASDARLILRAAVLLNDIAPEWMVYADADADGTVSASDARLALRMSVQLEKSIPHALDVTVIKPYTCTSAGELQYVCKYCDVGNTLAVPCASHVLTEEDVIVAGCETEGLRVKSCKNCSYAVSFAVPVLGHDMQAATASAPATCTRCAAKVTGWNEVGDKSYYFYFDEDGNVQRAVNTIIGDYYVDKTGVRVDDSIVMAAVNFVNTHSSASQTNEQRLKTCFLYLAENYDYQTRYGIPTATQISESAAYMFENKKGNCYCYGASFAYIAAVLGYDSGVIMGEVWTSNGWSAHGLTEVYADGAWLMCDATRQRSIPKKDWYLQTPASYPATYKISGNYRMSIAEGVVSWK